MSVVAAVPGHSAQFTWISFTNGRLVYAQDSLGNRIPDYSYAGYGGGGVAIPTVPTRVTAPAPSGGDDTGALQAAINKAAALPLDASGFRGAVQLATGTYHLAGTLSIKTSGVVLRGASGNASDTVIAATGATARTLLTIGGSSSYQVIGSPAQVTDTYVPVGGTTITLASTNGFTVGDKVVVQRPTTQTWIDAIGMNGLWSPNWSLYFERTITAINGNKITVDVPLTTALEKQFTQATVWHYAFPRINHVGVENLSADGLAMTADPNYASSFYNSSFSTIGAVEDSWVTNVFTHHFGQNGVTGVGAQSRHISVIHTGALEMVTTSTSARSDGYTLQGQENLIQDCTLTASKVHAFVTEARQAGPNVFSRCTATVIPASYSTDYDSGGHQRWGSGTLYDDLTIQGTQLMVNNGSRGTGHGWSDANSTSWNCKTTGYEVQDPPTAHNWAVGCTGTVLAGTNGEVQSPGVNVAPTSLYDEQLAERSHAAATATLGTTFTQVTAEGGQVNYDITKNPGNGTYTELGANKIFGLDFKQALRNSPHPVLIATITPTTAEHFRGLESLQFQINDYQEPGTPAYKADLAVVGGHDSFDANVVHPNDRYLGFAVKIDPNYYVLPTSDDVIFSQWHQGSPMHPVVTLSIVTPADAAKLGWPSSPNGRFALVIRNDNHNALNTTPGAPLEYDLGPVQTGVWLTWVTHVRAGLTSPGDVTVWENGTQLIDVNNQLVGYNPNNPQYGSTRPPAQFDWISLTLYREHGLNHQRLFFDQGKFGDNLAAATP
ncbi:MAG TPA: heparin lyase I family protein [Pseudonocardiaceae bacterium]